SVTEDPSVRAKAGRGARGTIFPGDFPAVCHRPGCSRAPLILPESRPARQSFFLVRLGSRCRTRRTCRRHRHLDHLSAARPEVPGAPEASLLKARRAQGLTTQTTNHMIS